jgi:hypothetical protein
VKKHPAVDALAKASKGLRMPSESDAPFQVFLWKDKGDQLTLERLRKLAGAQDGDSVEELNLDTLFQTVPSADRAKFQKLAAVIKEQLSAVQVSKIGGGAERDVYIVGRTKDGQWVGLKTSVVET